MRIPRNVKQYKLTNHLGNVLSTVLDRKTPITATGGSSSSTTITHYEGDVVFATDYYPFGSPMSWSTPDSSGGRMYSGGGYRYGFNGQEKEPELGDYYAFEYRIHDARLGRFLSVDPIGGNYPWQSVYAYFKNCPILIIDFLGLGEEPKSGNKVKEPNWWYAYVEDVDINQRNIAKASYKFHLWMFRMHLDKAERSEMQNIEDLPFGIYRSLRVDIFTKKINEKYCRKYWNYSKPGFSRTTGGPYLRNVANIWALNVDFFKHLPLEENTNLSINWLTAGGPLGSYRFTNNSGTNIDIIFKADLDPLGGENQNASISIKLMDKDNNVIASGFDVEVNTGNLPYSSNLISVPRLATLTFSFTTTSNSPLMGISDVAAKEKSEKQKTIIRDLGMPIPIGNHNSRRIHARNVKNN